MCIRDRVVGAVDDSTDIAFAQFDVNEAGYLYNTEDGSLLVVPYSINGSEIPREIFLGQNYPNPVKNSTQISYGLSRQANVTLSVYNLRGQLIDEIERPNMEPGYHTVAYDMHDLRSGIYFYKLTVDGAEKDIHKLVLLR